MERLAKLSFALEMFCFEKEHRILFCIEGIIEQNSIFFALALEGMLGIPGTRLTGAFIGIFSDAKYLVPMASGPRKRV